MDIGEEDVITVSTPVDHDEAWIRQNQALITLLKSWEDDDPEDQRETWAILKDALARDRFNIPDRLSDV